MKARVKATGEIVDVYERYDDLAMETVFEELAGSYRPDELDFNVEETEEVTIDGWVARNKDNSLYLFKAEPWYNSIRGYWDDHLMSIGCFSIPSESFPHITFDNSPIEITLTLKPKKR